MSTAPSRRAYDHRIRELVCQGQDPSVAAELGVPRSTAVSWIRGGPHPVVAAELFTRDEQQLRTEFLKLQRRVQVLLCIVRLLLFAPAFGFPLGLSAPANHRFSGALGVIQPTAL